MLWSLIKILVFVAVVMALTYGALYLMDAEGGALVTVAGYEVALSPLQLAIAFVLLVALVWVALKVAGFLVALVHFLNGDETAISRYFSGRRERRGLNAFSEGMTALASGDGRLALTKAEKADRFLNRPEMTNVLKAQAAELAGDRRRAEETYRAMLTDDRTRFVGVRGLMHQKLAAGDTETALKLAEKAFALRPRHDETSSTLLRLQAEREDWKGARGTLAAKLRNGTLPRDLHRRRDAVLALSEARELAAQGHAEQARDKAIEANRLSPDLIPAAVVAARAFIEKGQGRYANRAVKKAWEKTPHPDLAAAFAEIEPNEKPPARIKRFQTLTRLHPRHAETRMLLAELHISAEDFPAARRALGDLVETDPTARVLTLMAAIERGEGSSDTTVRAWLAKALTAPRGPQWVCENCREVHSDWQPVCSNCKSFDTLAWTRPPQQEVAMPRGAEMLPLIVGSIEDRSAESPDVDAEVVDVPPPEEPAAPERRPEAEAK